MSLLLATPWVMAESALIDPTMPAYYQNKQSTAPIVLKPNDEPRWVLNTTLIDPYKKLAIINGKQLTVGEEINGAELLEIAHQKVTLKYQSEIIVLDLHQSFIHHLKKSPR